MAVGRLKALIRFKTDEWISAKIEELSEDLSRGVTVTSISEAGKNHSQERDLPIDEVIKAVTDVAHERGLGSSTNVGRSRWTKATFS